jgi:hypothetical protein
MLASKRAYSGLHEEVLMSTDAIILLKEGRTAVRKLFHDFEGAGENATKTGALIHRRAVSMRARSLWAASSSGLRWRPPRPGRADSARTTLPTGRPSASAARHARDLLGLGASRPARSSS